VAALARTARPRLVRSVLGVTPNMRKLLVLVASVVLASACAPAEGGVADDEDFDRDWKEDFENDDEEAAAEEKETAELDELDDLEDAEGDEDTIFPAETDATTDPEGGPGPGEEPWPEGTDEYIEETTGVDPGLEPGMTPPPKKKRKHGPISIIEDDPNFSGHAGYDGSGKPIYDKAKSEDRLNRAKALGADAIRIMLWWSDKVPGGAELTKKPDGFASSKPDQYDWRGFDMQVEGARNRGMKVLVTIPAGPMPYWASEEPAYCVQHGGWSCAWKPQYKEYAKWVTAVGRHIKSKGYRVWGVTFVNEPNIGAFLKDETPLKLAHRYRKLWFHARKALRKTAGVKTRVFFSDQANNQKSLEPDATRWKLFNQSLCLDLEKDAELIPGFCPSKKRRVEVQGVAFHPYASTPGSVRDTVNFLHRLVDEAAREKRLPRRRGLYMTESAFLTARAQDASKLGAALSVSNAQQAQYMNQAERMLSKNPRVKSFSQYELVDEGRGTWDCGLIFANGTVTTKSGESVSGDFVEFKIDDHITVLPTSGPTRVLAWADIASTSVAGPGGEKPAYAAYRLGIDVIDKGDKVDVWGLARPDSGAGFTIEGLFASGEWQEIKTVKTDRLGFGRALIPKGTATAWRLRFGADLSRAAK
jgi:hypothetical protein